MQFLIPSSLFLFTLHLTFSLLQPENVFFPATAPLRILNTDTATGLGLCTTVGCTSTP